MAFITGCNSSHHEDEESLKTPAAVSRSLESTLLQIQTQSPCHKGENQNSGLTSANKGSYENLDFCLKGLSHF